MIIRVERFEREARAASALNHPNILTIHDVGREGVEAQRGRARDRGLLDLEGLLRPAR